MLILYPSEKAKDVEDGHLMVILNDLKRKSLFQAWFLGAAPGLTVVFDVVSD